MLKPDALKSENTSGDFTSVQVLTRKEKLEQETIKKIQANRDKINPSWRETVKTETFAKTYNRLK